MARGALVLVVGPSGAGKDALIGAAREALKDDARFLFPRRIVTRRALTAIEDHDSLDLDSFRRQKQRGAFALDWEAHGLCYALPVSLEAAMMAGRIVVTNVSRTVIPAAVEKYERCHVFLISVPLALRAVRLAARGREDRDAISQRLAREGSLVPSGILPVVIDNSGTLEDGSRRFLKALTALVK
jgi:phosphonate metabolism protein PhnN/1,5-bisphosphokinase (PRPP-forming)